MYVCGRVGVGVRESFISSKLVTFISSTLIVVKSIVIYIMYNQSV